MRSDLSTRAVVWVWSIAHPTTRKERASRTAHRYAQPLAVRRYVMPEIQTLFRAPVSTFCPPNPGVKGTAPCLICSLQGVSYAHGYITTPTGTTSP